ncbi:MAG: peptide-methionine (S)-S-oxide reductase [Proteobacteria bacterium]|nr:peptide-methionine (S)-S-oxide reductase [Pseudomonadota bacterium]
MILASLNFTAAQRNPPASIRLLTSSLVLRLILLSLCATGFSGTVAAQQGSAKSEVSSHQTIVVGGGCFWCMEAVFRSFKGVVSVQSGYAGGAVPDPSYHNLGTGAQSHAEVIRIEFAPATISLQQLLTIFFHAHDPTTKDRQGADSGAQYRSIILFADSAQEDVARSVLNDIAQQQLWGDAPIVTEIAPLLKFYPAEEYHQNYYAKNPKQGYCSLVIAPKLRKIRSEFKELLSLPMS